jgi:hypothetical protein
MALRPGKIPTTSVRRGSPCSAARAATSRVRAGRGGVESAQWRCRGSGPGLAGGGRLRACPWPTSALPTRACGSRTGQPPADGTRRQPCAMPVTTRKPRAWSSKPPAQDPGGAGGDAVDRLPEVRARRAGRYGNPAVQRGRSRSASVASRHDLILTTARQRQGPRGGRAVSRPGYHSPGVTWVS